MGRCGKLKPKQFLCWLIVGWLLAWMSNYPPCTGPTWHCQNSALSCRQHFMISFGFIWPFWPWHPCKASLPHQTDSIFRSSRQPVDPRSRHPEAWKVMKYNMQFGFIDICMHGFKIHQPINPSRLKFNLYYCSGFSSNNPLDTHNPRPRLHRGPSARPLVLSAATAPRLGCHEARRVWGSRTLGPNGLDGISEIDNDKGVPESVFWKLFPIITLNKHSYELIYSWILPKCTNRFPILNSYYTP